MTLNVYTDGACSKNGTAAAVGGWGYVVLNGRALLIAENGKEKSTTNQRMELTAAIKALQYVKDFLRNYSIYNVRIYTDSAYLYNCYSKEWWKIWLATEWRNSKGYPVANSDLWKELVPFFKDARYKFIKVKSHSGDEFNEYVDRLAKAGIKTTEEVNG